MSGPAPVRGQANRSYTVIALAIIIAGVLISASVFVAVGGITKTTTETSVATSTTTVTSTASSVSISTTTLTSTSTTTLTSHQTVTVTSTIANNSTSAGTTGSPIPVASVETAVISIGGAPRTIAVDPNSNRVYIADWFNDNLTVVDASSHSVVARVTLPAANNNGIAVDPNTGMVYVLVEGGVAVINGTTDKVVGELPLNLGPGSLAYDPTTHIIYGSPETIAGGRLIGADVRTGSIVANISLGYWADSVAVDPRTDTIYATGCEQNFVCSSVASVVNGTSEKLTSQVQLGSAYFPRVTVNPATGFAYVSGAAQLAALNDAGKVVYSTNPQACGPFDSMTVVSSSNQVLAISLDYEYMLVYDGAAGALVNMYAFTSTPQFVAFNPNTNEVYVTTSGNLVAFQSVASTGHVNSSLVGSGANCLPV